VLSPDAGMYALASPASIAPGKLSRALLLQVFRSIRSERQLTEQLDRSLLFRWFVGLSVDALVGDASTFSKNRDRLLGSDVAQRLPRAVITQPRVKALMPDGHFLVGGTLIRAWASHTSFQPKSPPPPGNASDPPAGTLAPAPAGPPSPAARRGTGAGRSAATRHMPASPTRTRAWRAGRAARPASSPVPGTCRWRTATGWLVSRACLPPCERDGGARRGARARVSPAGQAADHVGCRQGLRRAGLHRRPAPPQLACAPDCERATRCRRRAPMLVTS